MNLHQKSKIFTFKFSPKSRSYIYFCFGLILAGLILTGSSNYSKSYSSYSGFEYRFGWDNAKEEYFFLNYGIIPQGLKGQKIDVLNRFTDDSDPGFGLHLLLMHGREYILQNDQYDWLPNISFNSLKSNAVYIQNFTYNVQNTQRVTISLSIPNDDAYIIIFIADASSISGNLTGTLIVDQYYLHGQDNGAMLFGTVLIGMGISGGGIIIFYPKLLPFFKRKKLFPSRKKGLNDSSSPPFTLQGMNPQYINRKFKQKGSNEESIQKVVQNCLILIKYDFQQVFGSPFIIGFLPMLVIIVIERFREVFQAWGPEGGYIFGEFGTTIVSQGVILYVFELSVGLTFSFLFLFREFDEGIHKLRIALPFSRKTYMFSKLFVLLISSLLICGAFVGGTFLIIPLRNPTIGFQPISLIWVPFLAYGTLSFVFLCVGLFLALILKNSRYTVMTWLGIIITWLYLSADLQKGFYPYTTSFLELSHQQETINSFFSIFSPERVIEFFLLRPLAPDWILENRLLFLRDNLIDPIIIIILHLLFAFGCILISFIIFRRRDL